MDQGRCPKPRDLSLLHQNRSTASGRRAPPRPFRHLGRRSDRLSALPYPPPRPFQNGKHQPSRAMILH
jgi:hypothetical protein